MNSLIISPVQPASDSYVECSISVMRSPIPSSLLFVVKISVFLLHHVPYFVHTLLFSFKKAGFRCLLSESTICLSSYTVTFNTFPLRGHSPLLLGTPCDLLFKTVHLNLIVWSV